MRGTIRDILAPDGIDALRKVRPDLAITELPRIGHAPIPDEPEAVDVIQAFVRDMP